MGSSIASLLVPAALFLGQPANPPHATYERGLFCDSVDLVVSIVEIADRGGDPHKAVGEINRTLDRNACFYTNDVDVLMEVGQFQRLISANHTTYGIYQVYVSAIGHQTTEIGDLAGKYSHPMVMYSLRAAPAEHSVSANPSAFSH